MPWSDNPTDHRRPSLLIDPQRVSAFRGSRATASADNPAVRAAHGSDEASAKRLSSMASIGSGFRPRVFVVNDMPKAG